MEGYVARALWGNCALASAAENISLDLQSHCPSAHEVQPERFNRRGDCFWFSDDGLHEQDIPSPSSEAFQRRHSHCLITADMTVWHEVRRYEEREQTNRRVRLCGRVTPIRISPAWR